MKNLLSAAIFLITAPGIVLVTALGWTASSPTRVTIHVPSKSLSIMPYYFGKDKGFFAPELVEPQLVMMSPPTAIAALVAGELDFSSTTGAATSAIMRGLPLRRYFYVQAEPAHVLLAQPEIKSIQELNGKTIGVTALTDAVGMSTTMILKGLKNQKFSLAGLALAYMYAMFPLGFWAALIGALTTPLMYYLKEEYGQFTLLAAAVISGAVIGSVFMFGFVHVSAWIQRPTDPVDVSLYVVCGLAAGSIVGLLAAWLVDRVPSRGGAVA
jgi:ABC-type nitrate/sulfonate/bicarbonate transport system substrate-binding protein